MDYHKPIPLKQPPVLDAIEVEENGEPLVCLSDYGEDFIFEPVYYNKGIQDSISTLYAREQVAQKLLKASKLLPHGYKFKIFDAWRPFDVQMSLYNSFLQENLELKSAGKSREEIRKITRQYVTFPSRDPMKPFLHATGGAIDLTIVDQGRDIDMGTEFDAFIDKAHTCYFEINNSDATITRNRRLLYNVMSECGFVNYPFEWWHFDYGDPVWAFYNSCNAIYGGIGSCE